MPTKKKKTKPSSNPARGFATTSIVSKAKPQDVEEGNPDVSPKEIDLTLGQPVMHVDKLNSMSQHDVNRPLHDLSPEELEQQLEESSLQVFVESQGDKVKKIVARQLSKLHTERRLLRGQAMPLSTRHWLPEDIMQLITLQLDAQQTTNVLSESLAHNGQTEGETVGDDLLAKIWTLRQILPSLGFPLEGAMQTLHHLITSRNKVNQKALIGVKDSCWGLDQCLSWLAFTSNPEDLPSFETENVQRQSSRKDHKIRDAMLMDETGESALFQ